MFYNLIDHECDHKTFYTTLGTLSLANDVVLTILTSFLTLMRTMSHTDKFHVFVMT